MDLTLATELPLPHGYWDLTLATELPLPHGYWDLTLATEFPLPRSYRDLVRSLLTRKLPLPHSWWDLTLVGELPLPHSYWDFTLATELPQLLGPHSQIEHAGVLSCVILFCFSVVITTVCACSPCLNFHLAINEGQSHSW